MKCLLLVLTIGIGIGVEKVKGQVCASANVCGDGYCCKYSKGCLCSMQFCKEVCSHGDSMPNQRIGIDPMMALMSPHHSIVHGNIDHNVLTHQSTSHYIPSDRLPPISSEFPDQLLPHYPIEELAELPESFYDKYAEDTEDDSDHPPGKKLQRRNKIIFIDNPKPRPNLRRQSTPLKSSPKSKKTMFFGDSKSLKKRLLDEPLGRPNIPIQVPLALLPPSYKPPKPDNVFKTNPILPPPSSLSSLPKLIANLAEAIPKDEYDPDHIVLGVPGGRGLDKPDIHALTDLVDRTPMVGNPQEWEDEYNPSSDTDATEIDPGEDGNESDLDDKVENELEKQEALDDVWNDWTVDDEDITRYYELLDWDSEFDDIPSFNGGDGDREDNKGGGSTSPDKPPKRRNK